MGKRVDLERIEKAGVIAIIRAESPDRVVQTARALRAGGIEAIEVTVTTPGALDLIHEISTQLAEDTLVGAGSVLDTETGRAAMLAGAEFIVSPTLNTQLIEICRRYNKIVIPGAFTPTEILTAWETGADAVKVFPARVLGPRFLRNVLAPLPQVRLVPTGGVSLENAADFIRAGASFLGVGGSLVNKQAVADGNWDKLTETARSFVQTVRTARAVDD